MEETMNYSRRRFLSGVAVAGMATLAGCRDDAESEEGPQIPPRILFSFAYEPAEGTEPENVGTLTVTHEGDESVEANKMIIRGRGIIQMGAHDYSAGGVDTVDTLGDNVGDVRFDADTADWSESGGSEILLQNTTGTVEEGDSVKIGVRADYSVIAVWDPPELEVAAHISDDEGPQY